jgi:hypothetical protein
MTPLERRYRRVLRVLPADYRAKWEEDMVDTFLLARRPDHPDAEFDAEFDAEYGRPSWTEMASVVGLAARVSLGGVYAPPRSFARGEIVRRVALAGLLVHAVSAVVGVVSLLVVQTRFPEYRVSDLDTLWALCGLLWVGSYLVLLADRRHLAAWLGTAALVPSVLNTVTDLASGGVSVATAGYRFLVAALPLLALAAFHRDAPAVRARPWLIALPVGVVVVMAAALVTQTPGAVALDWPGMLCVAAVVAGLALLVSGRRGPWTGALPVLAVVLLGERVLTLIDYDRFFAQDSQTSLLITTGLVQAAALVLVTAPLVIRRAMVRGHTR